MLHPESPTIDSKASLPTFWRVAFIVAAAAIGLIGVIAALVLVGGPDLLKPAGGGPGQLKEFTDKVEGVRIPATIAVGSVSSVGLLAGAGMSAAGMQSGVRTMATSAMSGGAVILGNGVIA